MKIVLSIEIAQALLNYLQTKPYAEVNQLISALLQAEKQNTEITEQKAE